jgi:hypothetical protein
MKVRIDKRKLRVFLEGVVSAFDLTGSVGREDTIARIRRERARVRDLSSAENLAEDWRAVGRYLSMAMSQYDEASSQVARAADRARQNERRRRDSRRQARA